MIELAARILAASGAILCLLAAVALIRMNDIYGRIAASTKLVTAGLVCVLLSVVVTAGLSALGIKAFICIIFFLLTFPVEAHALGRAAMKSENGKKQGNH